MSKPRISVFGVKPSPYGGRSSWQLYDGRSLIKALWTIRTKGRRYPTLDVVAREPATATLHVNASGMSPAEAVAALGQAWRRQPLAWSGRP